MDEIYLGLKVPGHRNTQEILKIKETYMIRWFLGGGVPFFFFGVFNFKCFFQKVPD